MTWVRRLTLVGSVLLLAAHGISFSSLRSTSTLVGSAPVGGGVVPVGGHAPTRLLVVVSDSPNQRPRSSGQLVAVPAPLPALNRLPFHFTVTLLHAADVATLLGPSGTCSGASCRRSLFAPPKRSRLSVLHYTRSFLRNGMAEVTLPYRPLCVKTTATQNFDTQPHSASQPVPGCVVLLETTDQVLLLAASLPHVAGGRLRLVVPLETFHTAMDLRLYAIGSSRSLLRFLDFALLVGGALGLCRCAALRYIR